MVKKYEGKFQITDSLKLALETQMNSFSEDDSPFAVRSLESIRTVKRTTNFKNKTTKLHTVQLVVTVYSLSLTLLKNQRVP